MQFLNNGHPSTINLMRGYISSLQCKINLWILCLTPKWNVLRKKTCYSWVEILFCSGSPHVACSTEPCLARFFNIDLKRTEKHDARFFGTVSLWSLFWHCRPSIAEYKTWSTSSSDWQFFCCSVFWWCQGRVRKKNCWQNCSGMELSTIFAGGVIMSGLKGKRVGDSPQRK